MSLSPGVWRWAAWVLGVGEGTKSVVSEGWLGIDGARYRSLLSPARVSAGLTPALVLCPFPH